MRNVAVTRVEAFFAIVLFDSGEGSSGFHFVIRVRIVITVVIRSLVIGQPGAGSYDYAADNGGFDLGAGRLADGLGLGVDGAMKRRIGEGQSRGTWWRRAGSMSRATLRPPDASEKDIGRLRFEKGMWDMVMDP